VTIEVATACCVCASTECKWPGACYGRCQWCGEPTEPARLLRSGEAIPRDDGLGPLRKMHCSRVCGDAYRRDGEARGLVIHLSDVTPERADEILRRVLAGSGDASKN